MTPQEAKIILMTENIGDSEEMEMAKHIDWSESNE